MRVLTPRRAVAVSAALLVFVLAAATNVDADPPPHRLGDHPAIVVQRLHRSAGYDYASKFYPHPAWLYLSAEAPRDVTPEDGR